MNTILFGLVVIILSTLFIVSAVIAHTKISRRTAGWWAGVVLVALLLGASHSQLTSIPTVVVDAGCSRERHIDWRTIADQTIKTEWRVVIGSLIFIYFAIEILSRMDLGERAIAILLLFSVMTSGYTIIYIFLIRKLGYFIFSFVMGGTLGGLLNFAFGKGADLLRNDDKKN